MPYWCGTPETLPATALLRGNVWHTIMPLCTSQRLARVRKLCRWLLQYIECPILHTVIVMMILLLQLLIPVQFFSRVYYSVI
jgi:hypothetical protein